MLFFFLNGKNFCLRGVQEHSSLRFSQLKRCYNPDHYVYIEFSSKNHSGGITDAAEGKVVPIMQNGSHSHVHILDVYLSKVPQHLLNGESKFYLKPLQFTPTGETLPWYWDEPISRKKLQTMVKDICTEAQVEGNFTNHSLRATGATALFDAGVPETIIQKRTGHKSLKALRCYEWVSLGQNVAGGKILDTSATDFDPDESFSEQDLGIFDQAIGV